MSEEIQMIPISQIRFLNPRHRDRKKFATIIESIQKVGLKKPIQVSPRRIEDGEEPGYDLVYGQGRIEAFIALGHTEIPAIVVALSKEERLVRSLVENIARRHVSPYELMNEIERLKDRGYSNLEIAGKLGIPDTTVGGLLNLKTAGEERLVDAAARGAVPLSVAMDIAKADSIETQRELLRAYEKNELSLTSIRTVKRLIDQRRLLGKGRDRRGPRTRRTSTESLVAAYKRERERQKSLIRKAKVCEAKLLFVVTAFGKLLSDENFLTLLRAEGLATFPKCLWARASHKIKEAA